MNKLKKYNTSGILGISHRYLKNFKNDNNLNTAIKYAIPELNKIKNDNLLDSKFIQKDILNFYNNDTISPFSPVSAKGPWIIGNNGSIIYDTGGYGMLGYGHCPDWALQTMSKPHVMANIMTPNNMHHEFTELIKSKIGINRAKQECPYTHFAFLNSGSEGMEFALRLSDIDNYDNNKPSGFIVLENGFHGRTTSASIISNSCLKTYSNNLKSYKTNYPVFTVKLNNVLNLQEQFLFAMNTYNINAIVMEPVMGEGNPGEMLSKDFYNTARNLTNKYNSLFIIDSVQAGIRTNGYLSVVDYPTLKNEKAPDIEVFSKAINAGQYPLSVIAVNDNVANKFKTGIYGNTMTGNPKALDIGFETLKRLTPELISNIQTKGIIFKQMLQNVKNRFPYIADNVTGQGLLLALHIKKEYPVVNSTCGLEYLCRKNGLNVIHGGENALRFTPYFLITDKEIKLVEKILIQTFNQYAEKHIRNI